MLENTEGAIKNGQARKIKTKTQHNTNWTPLNANKHK